MKLKFTLIAVLLAISVVALTGRVSAQTASGGKLRFLHALPGGPSVDVFVDNVLAARGLDFAEATRFLNVNPGEHTIVVTATGTGAKPSGTPLLTVKSNVSLERPVQLVVIEGDASKPEAVIYDQDLGPTAPGNARVTAIHSIKDAPPVDVLRADGTPIIQGLKYGEAYGGIDIPAGSPKVALVPAGGDVTGAVVKPSELALNAGTLNTVVALGTLEGAVQPSLLLLTAPTEPNAAGDLQVRFVNVSNGKAVDLYVNGKLVAPNLAPGDTTEHISVAAGEVTIDLRNAGDATTAEAVASSKLDTTAKAQTVVISEGASNLVIQGYPDDMSALDPTKARVTVINVFSAPAALTVDGKTVAGNVTIGQPSKAVEFPAGVYKFDAQIPDLNINSSGTIAVNGGTLSDLIIAGTPDATQLVLATTGISEQPGSVPIGANPAVVQAPTIAGATPDASVPTAVAQAPTATADAPVAPAATATLAPTETPRLTVATGATGVVNTNPDVNLKIREYPSTSAKTLALVPSQSTVNILGVAGPTSLTITPAPAGTKAPTPTLVATSRADVWVYVVWDDPNGGKVTGWTNSQYLTITINGRLIGPDNTEAVLSLKQIPADTFGVVESSSTPVAPDDKRTIGTVTTQPGTNAQLRRTPGVTGESLALVPSGAYVYVYEQTSVPTTGEVGQPKSTIWYYVQYDVEGSTVLGWMSADFLVLTTKYNGKPVDPSSIPVATEIKPGEVIGTTPQVLPTAGPGVIATVVNLDPGANLQLRRDPNKDAESLALIPLGTEMPAIGRNGAGSWIQVTYNGQVGWVSGGFVRVTKDGKPYPVDELPITNGEPDTFGTTTPTATPVGAG